MGSMNSPNSWAPNYTYRDCSQGICSIYCPQWCYLNYPPPPPFSLTKDDDDYTFNFSTLIIAVIGILSSAILLIAYYRVLSKYRRGRATTSDENQVIGFETNQVTHLDHYQASLVGLDESTIKAIAVFKYKKGDASVDHGTECLVCLSEFQENEDLRLLPKCNHYFHVVCIDTWLKSHFNCPLCRANVISVNPVTSAQDSSSVTVPTPPVLHGDDVNSVAENGHEIENDGVRVETWEERSNSLSVADILRIKDDDEDIEMGNRRFCSGVGSSQGDNLMKNG